SAGVVCVPPRAAARILNALVSNALVARPRSRVVIGPRCGGRWILVADDGSGMSASTCAAVSAALAGGPGEGLGVGLSLARVLVGAWGGAWQVSSRSGNGTCLAFSTVAALS
ncbi:MAG: sensor histidine kinase, partial [Rhodospirillaceae bacterium]|nr:sensor histidine kinase [Rhodospirillaceae bacterium]